MLQTTSIARRVISKSPNWRRESRKRLEEPGGLIHGDKRFAQMGDFGCASATEKVSAPRKRNQNKEPTFALAPLVLLLVLSVCGIFFAAPPVLKQIGFVLTRMHKNHEISYPARMKNF